MTNILYITYSRTSTVSFNKPIFKYMYDTYYRIHYFTLPPTLRLQHGYKANEMVLIIKSYVCMIFYVCMYIREKKINVVRSEPRKLSYVYMYI